MKRLYIFTSLLFGFIAAVSAIVAIILYSAGNGKACYIALLISAVSIPICIVSAFLNAFRGPEGGCNDLDASAGIGSFS